MRRARIANEYRGVAAPPGTVAAVRCMLVFVGAATLACVPAKPAGDASPTPNDFAPPPRELSSTPQPESEPAAGADAESPAVAQPPVSTFRVGQGGAVTLDGEYRLELQDVTIKRPDLEHAPPGVVADDSVEVSVVLAGQTCNLSWQAGGSASDRSCWSDPGYHLKLVSVDGSGNAGAEFQVERVAWDAAAQSETVVRIERDATVRLNTETELFFIGHSHKRTVAGDTSPLIVELEYRPDSAAAQMEFVSLRPPGDSGWRWHEYSFEMLDHDYNDWMRLRIRRHLEVSASVSR